MTLALPLSCMEALAYYAGGCRDGDPQRDFQLMGRAPGLYASNPLLHAARSLSCLHPY